MLDPLKRMALEELGALEEVLGEPPRLDERITSIWEAYWQMRAFRTLDEPLLLSDVTAWLDAHDLSFALGDWIPWLRVLETERRLIVAEDQDMKLKKREDGEQTQLIPEGV